MNYKAPTKPIDSILSVNLSHRDAYDKILESFGGGDVANAINEDSMFW